MKERKSGLISRGGGKDASKKPHMELVGGEGYTRSKGENEAMDRIPKPAPKGDHAIVEQWKELAKLKVGTNAGGRNLYHLRRGRY